MSEIKGKNKIIRLARFEDGKLVLPAKEKDITPEKNEDVVGKDLDYIFVLKALNEIPFGVRKKLLIDFLQGDRKNKSIVRNKLHLRKNFGSLAYEKDELTSLINNRNLNDMSKVNSVKKNKRWKMMEVSIKGKKEIENP